MASVINRKDVAQLIPLLRAEPQVRGTCGRLGGGPDVVLGNRGHVRAQYRRLVGRNLCPATAIDAGAWIDNEGRDQGLP
ncbi:hypothetical protein [Streptomyces griseoluteus]